MDANEKNDSVNVMFELNNKVFSDTKEAEEPEGFLLHHEADSGDFPPSLLSYFETSKSRAAVCEKLILEELEDFPALHHSEDTMNWPFDVDMDTMKPNEQIICDPENEENNTFTDTRLLPAPTETHNVSVCPNNEDEAERDEYMESERQFLLELEAEREKRRCEEKKQEEHKRQIERDFQRELKKLMEAEKLQQRELESMARRAQERLEEELLLQQELMSSLKRRVEEERRRREEEQKRIKDEEKVKIEAERKRKEEERRMREEEEQKRIKYEEERVRIEAQRKREELKLKKEPERTCKEEEEEEKRSRDTLEKKKMEDEMKMMEEEERKNKENEERIKKKEEGRRKREEERRNTEAARKMEKRMSQKEEEEEEGKKREEKSIITQEEMRISEEIEEGKKQKEESKEKEGEEALKRMCEEMKERDERKYLNTGEEIKLDERKRKEEKDRKRREEVQEVMRNKEGDDRVIQEEPRPVEEVEKRKREDDRKMKEEEGMRRQTDEMRENEEQSRKIEEINHKEDEQKYKEHDLDRRESKTKDYTEEKNSYNEELRNREEQGKSAVAEKKLDEEDVNKETKEKIRLKVKEESRKRRKDRETGEIAIKASELQEKRKDSNLNKDETGNTEASPVAGSSTWTSWSESTKSPISPGSVPQHHDPEESISQTSTDETSDCEKRAARPSTVSVSLAEHTEEKRLTWMKDCTSWSRLSLQNRRKQNGSVRSRRGLRGAPQGSSLPPLCTDSLLQAAGCKSLQEVTSVTLEDLPGCSLSSLAQCTRLQSLTLRRCGLKSLEGLKQLPQLCYVDVQENDISFVDCENMSSLRVLQLAHNKLTSIHGLNGAENLDVLDLSHNSITRIAGLESMRRLQRLSVDHNQLISTRGLRDVCTLLHLNCSHNHLAGVEGLENSALLSTLDLRANSLTEAPSLNNHVLLRELHLDDNSVSSLQGLAACWLPLLQHLSVAQNRITRLPSMSDFVSLVDLDLRYNCLSELQNVCESLEGCRFLRDVHLTGNPLQQERGWSSTLQKAVPGLRASGDQQTDSFPTPPAAPRVSSASGGFLWFCQAQLQQTHYLQQQHSRELSNASSSLDAVKTCCRHSSEALQLAKEQRFAHEYGDTTVAAGQTTAEETLDMDSTDAENQTEHTEPRPVLTNGDKRSYRTVEGTFATVAAAPNTGPGCVHSSETKGKTTSSSIKMSPVSNHQDLVTRSSAAVVIQQLWRKYRQKCGNISSISTAERGGGGAPASGPSCVNGSAAGKDSAATVIQAFWRGFALRRRLASALAAVTCADSAEDDTFEEVDVDEFVFDEAVIEKPWTLSLSEDSPPRRFTVTEQLPPLKPPVAFPEHSQYFLPPPLARRPKQAWLPEEQVNSAGQRVSPESSNSKSPALTSVISGLSERSEKILEEWGFTDSHTALQMLKRAQNMKSAKQQQKKRRDPSVCLALFRNCSYQLGPVEAPNRPAQPNRDGRKGMHAPFQPPSSIQAAIQPHQTSVLMSEGHKVGGAEPGLRQAERGKRRLHTQAAQSDSLTESERFLPEISSDILNGGRVQLVADPGYTERLHHASGLQANNSLAARPCKENSYPHRNPLGHARNDVPSPQRVKSAPSRKERISFRDNPVRLSDGWGGGKKRDKVHK